MIDWTRIIGFDWDAGNAAKIAFRHDVALREAEQVFFNIPLLAAEDHRHSADEQRFNALGKTDDGRVLHVTFTLRGQGTLIRVISARDANRKERSDYGKDP